MNFTEFGLDPRLMEGIETMGYESATPVQDKVIPVILNGKDVIASAQTGTGKTAAYLLPIIHKLISSTSNDQIKALVIVPTRELAVQIEQQMQGFSYFTSVGSIAVYGGTDGTSFTNEQQALEKGADVVICTPGRMISHLNQQHVNVSGLEFLILDEADRMLDMGFYDDIMKILSFLPQKRQNLLFSATMPVKIREMANKILHEPEEISLALSTPPDKIIQVAYLVFENQKIPLLKTLLLNKKLRSILIFCSTKSNTKLLAKELKRSRLAVEEIHSDLEQQKREQVLSDFKSRKLNILVATDILSRGIDIEDIDLVINYDVPHDGEDYIHRIGRTARAEADGVAITLVNVKEQQKFAVIEKLLGKEVFKVKLPEELGEGPAYKPPTSGRRNDRHKGKNHSGKPKRYPQRNKPA